VVTGLRTDRREILISSTLDAIPDNRHDHPKETVWPLVMAVAVGVMFVGAIFTPWSYPAGFVLGVVAFAGWAWPRGDIPEELVHEPLPDPTDPKRVAGPLSTVDAR
jgi:cytochrome c oxidase subunit 1